MSEYDRLVTLLEDLCKFCPVCGKELIVSTKFVPETIIRNEVWPAYNSTAKACPEGHSILGVNNTWNPIDGHPEAVFTLDGDLFIPEHLRLEGDRE